MTKKTQKKLRKALLLISCAALLVCITVGVTVAYLTSEATVTNTFTVGNVQIALDEATVTYDATTNKYADNGGRTTQGNSYKLLPGTVIDKDPTVTVKANSEECYVRAMITVTYAEAADKIAKVEWIEGWGEGWNITNLVPTTTRADGKITRVYEVRYNGIVPAATADTELPAVFTTVEIPANLTNDELAALAGFEIEVNAEAIQADGFATADLAWAAWE